MRRRTLLAAPALLLGRRASAHISVMPGALIPNNASYQRPDVHISAGQSWRQNGGLTTNTLPTNPQTQTLLTQATAATRFPSGIIPISSGASLPVGTLNKLTGLTAAMVFPPTNPIASASDSGNALDIGRSAVLTQQLLRLAAGVHPLRPIINYNISYPSSTWASGPGGSLGNQTCSFTGSMAGSVLTVTGTPTGTIQLGQYVLDGGLAIGGSTNLQAPLYIASFGTGTGGAGTYNLPDTKVLGSRPLTTIGSSWYGQNLINKAIVASLPDAAAHLLPAKFRSVGWTQGGSFSTSTAQPTIDEWTAMTVAYDALALPGTDVDPLRFYCGIRAPNSDAGFCTQAVQGAYLFCRANANGRIIGTSPWYQWPFNGNDAIHTGDYGTVRNGECEGLAKYITEDEGTPFRPLWRSLATPITVNGQTVVVPFDRPVGTAFANSVLLWMFDPLDGIKVWPQNGWNVIRRGTPLTVTPTIIGMTVQLAVTEFLPPGDVIEVSYAFYGPGGPNPGPNSGAGGNLVMLGPPSVMFPGKTINAWAWPFVENVTV